MTVKEIYDILPTLTTDRRAAILEPLMQKFCKLSIGQLQNFQDTWDGTKPFEEFCKAQNEEIRICIKMEASVIGDAIRQTLGLKSLGWNTEIEIECNITPVSERGRKEQNERGSDTYN